MSVILMSASGIGILLGLVFLLLFRSLTSGKGMQALPANLENIFSPSRYNPMERLLDPLDREFLAAQAAYTRRLGRRFRANRIALFRGYLHSLGRDFARVSTALKVLMVHAPVDRSALAGLLLKQRVTFSYAMMSIEVKLALHRLGFSVPTADIRELIAALDTMGAQLRALTPVVQPSVA